MKNIVVSFVILISLTILNVYAHQNENLLQNEQKRAYTPESLLPDGVDGARTTNPYTGESAFARKGTLAATINNVVLLNELLSKNVSSAKDAQQLQYVIAEMNKLIPSAKVIGIYNLFCLEEWLISKDQPGRTLTAILYLQQYPKEITPKIKSKLVQLQQQSKQQVLKNEINKILKK